MTSRILTTRRTGVRQIIVFNDRIPATVMVNTNEIVKRISEIDAEIDKNRELGAFTGIDTLLEERHELKKLLELAWLAVVARS